MQKLLTVKDVASILKMSSSSIYKKAESGEIISTKIGTALRFTENSIINYIENCTNSNGNERYQGNSQVFDKLQDLI
jgi:excisionase family DNA binding protein